MQENKFFLFFFFFFTALIPSPSFSIELDFSPLPNPFLYRLTYPPSENADDCSYLLGTFHLTPPTIITPSISKAFDRSQWIATEMNEREAILEGLKGNQLKQFLVEGLDLTQLISKDEWGKITETLDKAHLKVENLEQLHPSLVFILIAQAHAVRAVEIIFSDFIEKDEGMSRKRFLTFDQYLTDLGRNKKLPIEYLETFEDFTKTNLSELSLCQSHTKCWDDFIDMLNSYQENEAYFAEIVLQGAKTQMARTYSTFRRGNENELFTQVRQFLTPAVSLRNKNWVPRILALLQKRKPGLIIVGAAHLVGPDNLLNLLEDSEVEIERIRPSN